MKIAPILRKRKRHRNPYEHRDKDYSRYCGTPTETLPLGRHYTRPAILDYRLEDQLRPSDSTLGLPARDISDDQDPRCSASYKLEEALLYHQSTPKVSPYAIRVPLPANHPRRYTSKSI